jgi:hypothetical protein
MQEPLNYKQPDFETPALQHRKVKLTWDDNEPDRKKILGRKFKEDQVKLILFANVTLKNQFFVDFIN